MNYTYEEWNELIKKYKNNEINIGVNLSIARQFIMNNSTKYSVFALIVLFLLPFIACITSIFIYHLWSILFIIGFVITFSSVCGMASTNFSTTTSFILGFGILTIIIYLVSSFVFVAPFFLSTITFISIFSFYTSIRKSIINDFAFNNYETFCYLLENGIILIK